MSVISSVNCRAPKPNELFRIKPGIERYFCTPTLRDPDTGVLHLVAGPLWPLLGQRGEWVCPRACASQGGEVFVWAMPVPRPGDDRYSWRASAAIVAGLAELKWVRVEFDAANGQYHVGTPAHDDDLVEPEWPAIDFLDLLMEAFRGHLVTTEDHRLVGKWGAA